MKNQNKHLFAITIAIFILTALTPINASAENLQTTLEIKSISGGFGKVIAEIENTGTEIAESIEIVIEVKGGFLGKIDRIHICSGCSSCGTTLDPGAIKTESTAEAGRILGFGPVDVRVSSLAANAPEVETITQGFVLGIFVISDYSPP